MYKIEIAYDDYKKVKVNVDLKKEIFEEIIENIEKNCEEIEIVKPKINGETKLGTKKFIVQRDNKKIVSILLLLFALWEFGFYIIFIQHE